MSIPAVARPSKKAERVEEIIDAYERCIIRHGVNGATLQRVADESGLARPLLHHNVGNREDLLNALIARLDAKSSAELSLLLQHLPTNNRCRAMIDLLFDPQYASDHHDVLLYQALQSVALDSVTVRELLLRWYGQLMDSIAQELTGEFPDAPPAGVRAVATGLLALYFNADAMASLVSAETLFNDSRQAAMRLLETL